MGRVRPFFFYWGYSVLVVYWMCYRVFCGVIGTLLYSCWIIKWGIIIRVYCYMGLYIMDCFLLFNSVCCVIHFLLGRGQGRFGGWWKNDKGDCVVALRKLYYVKLVVSFFRVAEGGRLGGK